MSSLLCLIAHPDDELFCAGLLAQLAALDIPVHLACLTRGEGGAPPASVSSASPSSAHRSIADVREQELRCAAQALSINTLSFLDYRDRPPTSDGLQAPAHDPATLQSDIRTLIDRYRPEAVLTHGSNGDYGHPAHALLHRMTLAVINAMPSAPSLYSFNAYHPTLPALPILNPDDWATFILDVSPFEHAKKASLACHESQWSVFVGSHPSPDAYRTALGEYVDRLLLESYCCHVPRSAPDPLTAWLGVERRDGITERMWQLSYTALRTLKHHVRSYIPTS
jgi:LmbE family N-acetylglucosaminyl deacetylase